MTRKFITTLTLTSIIASLGSAGILPEIAQEAFNLPIEENIPDAIDFGRQYTHHSNDGDFLAAFKPHIPYWLKPMVDSEKLQSKIELEDLNSTAWELYDIATHSEKKYGHPTRVIGSPGHWDTIRFILEQFEDMRDYYDVSLQTFKALSGRINSFNLSESKSGENFPNISGFSLSPPVKPFVGKLVEIPNLGCSEADFEAVEPPSNSGVKQIALIERGLCPFGDKSKLAGKFGFHAAVIYDNDPNATDGLHATLGKPNKNTVATIGVPFELGRTFIDNIYADPDYSLYFAMDSYVENIKTKNIIAETRHGDGNNIVALGAHSDSVEEGPGINDDGSGTISLLTVAKQSTHFKINNKVRFAWWSAEEEGLLGSNYYAYHLSEKENKKIRLFMDYDMMASPNYENEIYDANNIDNPKGSEELRDLYIDFYKQRGLNYTLIPFDGRSDYVGFIENGIPAGGIAAGAEKDNVFNGGVLDKCYHLLCDDVSNLNWEAFLTNTQLIAHSVATYAKSLKGFPERESKNETASISALKTTPLFKYQGNALVI
ncbi:hypothetical protein TBLA_0C02710 [Henningerozyma blattae CBS 6284]|uniref:Peptide hydrolase n=1 Tax=Henningerozyma blattae (strain ATCC 34711 / CBS 6284 / DSM 70876 / NBRC 10599 / NRRL Y-10934 / UCD 77-7) TaxID=1071380 RepID=I2H127_HENB6|nr:hypothetical protein TBLA_0C02710 [Tetrapisispora blattae CBS 6284]CCH60079.1 hypothetical protein TBLA_0C02710 [Tetrapisispora blattae CBS 6284]